MTGYGEAHYRSETLAVGLELRALNNRYLKVSVRAAEPYNLLEPEFEKVIRRTVRRGTIQVHLRIERQYAPQDFKVNAAALRSYVNQLRGLWEELGLRDRSDAIWGQILSMPGVVAEPGSVSFDQAGEWPLIEQVLQDLWKGEFQTQKECRRTMLFPG